ncbi:hypothetical protein [Mucilaginibacter sp. KACC 22063]|uniref:hypothetical protein n=1 Tax=Mucilaginibacter sp. KACC 22063 TaxID=3025666 RepID=UPI002365BADC|nr:hypothetical protein [Mucilaginibacter sp. KACC 22063]WDF56443.1 hypothetical protein PQ461_05185 [Mucilaginibacter sp. KACC 22063]
MKKLFLILALIIGASTLTQASSLASKASLAYTAPATGQSYSIAELSAKYNKVEFQSGKFSSIKAYVLPHGDVVDEDGNVVGYWVYDNNSGVLLIVLY